MPERAILHHLGPNTHYYIRFVAEEQCGGETFEKTFEAEFTTTGITKPEIARFGGGQTTFKGGPTTPHSAAFGAQIESNGAQTEYAFEYTTEPGNPASWKPFTSAATGTVTVAEDFANPEAKLTGLEPETTYFVRVKASNEKGETTQSKYLGPGGSELESFRTPTARPVAFLAEVRNVTASSAHLRASVLPNGSETSWRLEYTTEPQNAPSWKAVPGAAGTISQKEAQELEEARSQGKGFSAFVEGALTSLAPETTYYVRLFAENTCAKGCGEGVNGFGEPILDETQGIASFGTSGAPLASTFATHALHDEAIRLLGEVNPRSVPTSAEQVITIEGSPTGGTFTLSFMGQRTEPIDFHATAESVQGALGALSAIKGGVVVGGPTGGPYTVYFGFAELGGKPQPLISGDGTNLAPTEAVSVLSTQAGGESYATHYDFEYVSQKQFEEGGFSKASLTKEEAISLGDIPQVGADLPALEAGESYRYRISATNNSPGNPVVHGEAQTLTAPAPPEVKPEEACPNQALRTGPSASLPDCRAYEQLTPADKEGAQEIFRYDGIGVKAGAAVGQDGEHLMLEAPQVSWGTGPTAGQSPYFLSRQPSGAWKTTAAAAQPEAGLSTYEPRLFSSDMSRFAFDSSFTTSHGSGESKEVQFRTGPPGGPYTTLASVPRAQVGARTNGWVAASSDLSKLVLQVEDHTLCVHTTGTSTGTSKGPDLYEWSEGGCRQLNVLTGGAKIGSCGAKIANGGAEANETGQQTSSRHAVSGDGSRVFFQAVPGNSCSEAEHVYERVNGGSESAQTLDLGPYRFSAANPQGTVVLLEKQSGEEQGLYLYQGSGPATHLASSESAVGANLLASEDLSALYIIAGKALYRYDVQAQKLGFVLAIDFPKHYFASPDGRYFYFSAHDVPGLPAGAIVPGEGHESDHKLLGLGPTPQVYRYDSARSLVQCLSCSSSFDFEPRLGAYFGEAGSSGGQYEAPSGTPRLTFASADGSYVFFQSPAALTRSDVDGEVIPEGDLGLGLEHASPETSVSSDVYEWKAPGTGGCAQTQGCLALITNGRGGLENLLLGTTPSGRDVFIFSHSQLTAQDRDGAGDILDVRIGGGEPPPPPPPTECEGDACSTPASAPIDTTPSSFTFTGAGNIVQPVKAKKVKKKKRRRRGGRRKAGRGHKGKRQETGD